MMSNHSKKKRPAKKQPAWHHSNHSIKEPEDHHKQYVEDKEKSRSHGNIDGDESVHKISDPMHLIIW